MKSGERWMIYDDPITCLREEGEAVLESLMRAHDDVDGRPYQTWIVKFPDGEGAVRSILGDPQDV